MISAGLALYLLFLASWLTHASSRVPLLGAVGFDMILAAALAVLAVIESAHSAAPRNRASPTQRALLVLCVYIVATLPLVEWPGSALNTGLPGFVKALVFYFFTVAFVRTPRDIARFLAVFLACQVWRVAEPVFLHLVDGYWGSVAYTEGGEEALERLSGAPHDVVNPNGLAFVICTVLPFALLLGEQRLRSWLVRLPVIGLCLYALMLTGSRTGILALAVVYLGVLVKARARLLVAAAGFAVAATLAATLDADLRDRYLSLVGGGPKNEATLIGRIEGVAANFEVAARRPLFGHGLGTSAEANFHYAGYGQISHNLYAEIAEELGFTGLALFGWLMASIAVSVASLGAAGAHGGLVRPAGLRDALQVWLAVLLLFSFASYGLSSYEWYLLAGLVAVAARASSFAPALAGGATSRRRDVLWVDFEHALLAAPASGAQGAERAGLAGRLDGEPVAGSIAFLREAVARFDVVVHSPHCAEASGLRAVCDWLQAHGAPVDALSFAAARPPVRSDGSALLAFDARWPTLDELAAAAAGDGPGWGTRHAGR